MRSTYHLLLSTLIICISIDYTSAKTIYVNASASGTGDGLTWENAHTDLQDALTAAESGDEVWVAAGIYETAQATDQNATFNLKTGVALFGGFTPGDSDKESRSFSTFQFDGGSILSGESFSNHVVTADGVGDTAILDGFTITQGQADGGGESDFGGGLRINNASPIIRNAWIISNSATEGGGGAHITGSSNPTFEDSSFKNNNASSLVVGTGGGVRIDGNSSANFLRCSFEGNSSIRGGALFCSADSTATIVSSSFSSNSVSNEGGGDIYYEGATGLISDCRFSGAEGFQIDGAGIYVASGSVEIVRSDFTRKGASFTDAGGAIFVTGGATPRIFNNCFHGNKAVKGAGIYSENSSPVIVNNVFVGNVATDGGAFYTTGGTPQFINNSLSKNIASGSGGGIYSASGEGAFHNLILWANEASAGPQIFDNGMAVTMTYSNIQDGYEPGTEIISADPQFIEEPIEGEDTVWASQDDDYGDLRLNAGYMEGVGEKSPSIDAGNNALVPDDLPNLDEDETTEEPTPVDRLNLARFNDVVIVDDTGLGDAPVVDHGAYETGAQIVYVCPDPGATPPQPLSYWSFLNDSPGVGIINSGGLTGNAGVNNNGFQPGAGESWQNPLYSFHRALEVVQPGAQVWMAKGIYYPNVIYQQLQWRVQSWEFQTGTSVYGGFNATETSLEERNLENNETILSGETTDPDASFSGIITNPDGHTDITLNNLTIKNTYSESGEAGTAVKSTNGSMEFNNIYFVSHRGAACISGSGATTYIFNDCTWENTPNGAVKNDKSFEEENEPHTSFARCTAIETGDNVGTFFSGTGGIFSCIESNISGYESGGIKLIENISWLMTGNTISNCGGSGNLSVIAAPDLTPDQLASWGTCTGNNCEGGTGGNTSLDGNLNGNDSRPVVNIDGSTFRDGTNSRGGGIIMRWIDGPIQNSIIENNVATTEGGGIYEQNCTNDYTDVIMRGNSADRGSGAAHTLNCDNTYQRVEMSNNTANNNLASAWAISASTIVAEFFAVICNEGSTTSGVHISADSEFTATNGTFAFNKSTTPGIGIGGIWNLGTLILNSCVAVHNEGQNLNGEFNPDIHNESGNCMVDFTAIPQIPVNSTGANNMTGNASSILPPKDGDTCTLANITPPEGSLLGGSGDSALATGTDLAGKQIPGRRPKGAIDPSDFVEPKDTPGENDPPWIILDSAPDGILSVKVNEELSERLRIRFRGGDPDAFIHPEGELILSVSTPSERGVLLAPQGFSFTSTFAPLKIQSPEGVNIVGDDEGQGLYYNPPTNRLENDVITITLEDQGFSIDDKTIGESIKTEVTITVLFEVTDSDRWRVDNFPDTFNEDVPPEDGDWNDDADPDKDGFPNIVERAIGTNPRIADQELRALGFESTTGSIQQNSIINFENQSFNLSAINTREISSETRLLIRRSKLTGINQWVDVSSNFVNWAEIVDVYNLPGTATLVEEGEHFEIHSIPLSELGLPNLDAPLFFRMVIQEPD